MKTPIALPLEKEITRCLGHGKHAVDRDGNVIRNDAGKVVIDWCERIYDCGAHQTIQHDLPLWKAGHNIAIAKRKCWTENWVGYLPLDGFDFADEVAE